MNSWALVWDNFWDSSVQTCGPFAMLLALWFITNARKKTTHYKGRKITRGSIAYSERELAKKLGLTHAQIRWARQLLIECGFITHETTHHFSLATICKFDQWQDKSNTINNTPTTHQQHTNNTTSPVTYKELGTRNKDISATKKTSRCPLVKKGGKHKDCVNYISSKGNFPNFGKQVYHLHKIIAAGFSLKDLDSLIEEVEAEPFYQDKGWDFATLANEMGRRRG